MNKENFLISEIKKIGIAIDDIQIKQFLTYYQLLIEWNNVMNLTAITEYSEVVQKHFVDSLAFVKAMDEGCLQANGISLIKITLLDSLNKRIKFLNEVIEKLEINHIEAVHGRAEDFAKQAKYREQYDICVSRAVANLATLSEYALPYVKKNGYFISYKAENIEHEIEESRNAISILGGRIEQVEKFNLPDTDIRRTIIKIKKEKATEKKYPRKAGIPSKEPLK